MATFFPLPKLGMNQEEGEVVSWLVSEGDTVTEGQPIVEVETDKATVELEATASGVLARIVAGEGDIVPNNGVLAVILSPGEDLPAEIPQIVAGGAAFATPFEAAHDGRPDPLVDPAFPSINPSSADSSRPRARDSPEWVSSDTRWHRG